MMSDVPQTKTIFLMFSRSFAVRNILRTKVFRLLRARSDLRFVLFVAPNMPDYFKKDFDDPRIIFEEVGEITYSLLRRKFFEPMLVNLVYTDTGKFMARYGGRLGRKLKKNYFLFLIIHAWESFISKPAWIKKLFRFLDYKLFPDTIYDKYFVKYKPDLTIVTTVMSKRDRAMLKGAKRFNIPTIGITRGWDNLDRLFLPTVPDKLIVQNEVMREHAFELDLVPKEHIFVAGFPQFDMYKDKSIYLSRETFLQSLKLDPSRAVILYGAEGEWAPNDEHVVKIIYEMIKANALVRPCSLIIRPHFSDVFRRRYDAFKGLPNVFLDDQFRLVKFFTDRWDPDDEEMHRLANELFHSSLLITYISTLVIEGAIFDKPIININFYADSEPDQGPYFGRWYGATHYKEILKTGAVRLANNRDELQSLINFYLSNPENQRAERENLIKKMAYKFDGLSGDRMANFMLSFLDDNIKIAAKLRQ